MGFRVSPKAYFHWYYIIAAALQAIFFTGIPVYLSIISNLAAWYEALSQIISAIEPLFCSKSMVKGEYFKLRIMKRNREKPLLNSKASMSYCWDMQSNFPSSLSLLLFLFLCSSPRIMFRKTGIGSMKAIELFLYVVPKKERNRGW